MDHRRAGIILCIILALAWPATGLLFTAAQTATPLLFYPATLTHPQALLAWVATLAKGGTAYLWTYGLFTIADFSLLLLGLVLRAVVGHQDFRGQIVCVCVTIAMLLGVLVDVTSLSQWIALTADATAFPPSALAALWISLLEAQSLGLWLSVASFVIAALGLIVLAGAVTGRLTLRAWSRMSLCLAIVILAEVAAILWDVSTHGSGVLTGSVFLLLTVVVAPTWAIWLARLLARGSA